MLVDDVRIKVKAGKGGEGNQTYMGFRKGVKVGPTGGDGGRGGSVYFLASNNITDLSQFQFKKEIKAQSGENGMPGNHNGKDAPDITVLVPIGTKVIDEGSNLELEITDTQNPILIARGGERGLGSYSLSKREGKQTENRSGEEKNLRLILSLIADVGLIGLPNVGKSSLLERLTNANPKIGNYPFTTLEPNLGTIPARIAMQSVAGGGKIILADIPGLIEGASQGRGLGTKFLKHIEKTKILIHCISATDADPIKSYEIVRNEFEKHNPDLLKKKELILITKKDLITDGELEKKIKLFKVKNLDAIGVSVFDENSLNELSKKLATI